MILANGCNITKSEKFKGVWILSVPTVYNKYTQYTHIFYKQKNFYFGLIIINHCPALNITQIYIINFLVTTQFLLEINKQKQLKKIILTTVVY